MATQTQFGFDEARHLLARAGFGGRPAEIETAVQQGLPATVDALLSGPTREIPEPAWLADYAALTRDKIRGLTQEQRQEQRRTSRLQTREVIGGWVDWMISTPTPADMLTERMALIWHGLMPTSSVKVRQSAHIYTNCALCHRHAVGSYKDLLHGIIRDPAMLVYLDNTQNRRRKINENLAREIMELFSLGRGHYTETDIQEGARALTGYSLSDNFMAGQLRRFAHDRGSKTILGKTGNWDGDEFVDIILAQPACAEWVAGRLWWEFAGQPPADPLRRELAQVLREADYQVAPLLRHIFTHADFYAPQVAGQQIKSPIHLVVGSARTLHMELDDPALYLVALAAMGQLPYLPPNVKGWPGDRTWINTSRLLVRYTYAQVVGSGQVTRGMIPQSNAMRMGRQSPKMPVDLSALIGPAQTHETVLDRLVAHLMALPPTDAERADILAAYREAGAARQPDAVRQTIGRLMLLPQFQLV